MEELKVANFEVTETWTVECPHCENSQSAPFNEARPMEPMKVYCESCGEPFLLTYERD